MTAFLAHLLGLTLPGFWLGRRLRLPVPHRVGLLFLIFEASLIMGAGLLSWAGVLGQVAVYQFVTTLVACAIALGLWLVARHDAFPAKSLPVSAAPAEAIVPWYISTIGISIFAAFAAAMLYVTLSAYPAVEDSLTIKLPKIVFAIEANSILPTHLTDESRMYISPVYPALVQLFLVINGQTGQIYILDRKSVV